MVEKPEKTDCIAFCGWGWGYAREAEDAIITMLRHVPTNGLERLKAEKKKLEATIFECSEDWTVYDAGSVSAKYVVEYAKANLDPAFCIKLKDARNDLSEMLEYSDEAPAASS